MRITAVLRARGEEDLVESVREDLQSGLVQAWLARDVEDVTEVVALTSVDGPFARLDLMLTAPGREAGPSRYLLSAHLAAELAARGVRHLAVDTALFLEPGSAPLPAPARLRADDAGPSRAARRPTTAARPRARRPASGPVPTVSAEAPAAAAARAGRRTRRLSRPPARARSPGSESARSGDRRCAQGRRAPRALIAESGSSGDRPGRFGTQVSARGTRRADSARGSHRRRGRGAADADRGVRDLPRRRAVPARSPKATVAAAASGSATRSCSRPTRPAAGRCTSTPATRDAALPLVRHHVEAFGRLRRGAIVAPSGSCVGCGPAPARDGGPAGR